MSESIVNQIRLSYWSWIKQLAEIISTQTTRKRNWRVQAYMAEGSYEIYSNYRSSIKHVGTFREDSTGKEITALKKKMRNFGREKENRVVLRLSSSSVLQKTIKLPAGAQDVLELVIKNQMRRLVPWPENDTCFSYNINRDNSTTDEIDVTVIAASKSFIKAASERLELINIHPGFVEYSENPKSNTSYNLLSIAQNGLEENIKRVNRSVLTMSCILFIVAVTGAWQLTGKSLVFQENATRLTKLNQMIVQLKRRNRDNLSLINLRTFLIKKKKNGTPLTLVLEGLSKNLPDNAWLTKMEVRSDKITISGKARNATELVQAIESSPMMNKVSFSAPSTRVDISDLETFSIVANIVAGTKNNEGQ